MTILLFKFLSLLITFCYYIVIARCVLSFFPQDAPVHQNQIAFWIYRITDPVLIPLQKIIPPIGLGGAYIDFSPIVLLVILGFMQKILGMVFFNISI